jgi:hypothetical protein
VTPSTASTVCCSNSLFSSTGHSTC